MGDPNRDSADQQGSEDNTSHETGTGNTLAPAPDGGRTEGGADPASARERN